MKYKHEIFSEQINKGQLLIVPTLNKVLLVDKEKIAPKYFLSKDIPLTHLTINNDGLNLVLLTTYQCNLDCEYCYQYSGEHAKMKMDKSIIHISIKEMYEKAIRLNKSIIYFVIFGGEPTIAKEELFYAVQTIRDYEKKLGVKAIINMVSNGVFSQSLIDNLVADLDKISISVDGPPSIQNKQRPLFGGKNSFSFVEETLNNIYKEKDRCKLHIRVTLTNDSIEKIDEIVEFFASNYPGISQFYEPAMLCDRNKVLFNVDKFYEFFIPVMIKYQKSGILIKSSLFPLNIGLSVCNMANRVVVLPDGTMTGCHRINVDDKGDCVLKSFRYGKITKKGIDIDNNVSVENAKQLDSIFINNICDDCFLKYYCKGGCYALKLNLNLNPYMDRIPWCDKMKKAFISYFENKLKIGD